MLNKGDKTRIKKHLSKQQQENETHSILRVEDVRGRGVVQDQGFVELTAEATQVFNITALIEHARFTEQPCPEHATPIQQVSHWVCILQ